MSGKKGSKSEDNSKKDSEKNIAASIQGAPGFVNMANGVQMPQMNKGLMGSMSGKIGMPQMPRMPAQGGVAGTPGQGMPMPQGRPQPKKIDFEGLKDKLEDFRKELLKKYKFTISVSVMPPAASPIIEEEEQVPLDVIQSNPIHLLVLIPEDQYKNLGKIKPEVVKMIQKVDENIWAHIWTPVDLWNFGLDSKYDVMDAVSASFPIHDSGFLGALRVANIHKTLVLKKFERYVSTYAIGGSLVRGTADKTSDVDTFVIIDDTDVKRMPRRELLDRLRGIIMNDFIREASALAGVKNILNVQVYLLTDFWQSVKDAQPVMFTFIRDGIPMYDRGTFIPWKRLLQMGKIKPSQEAVDLFMKQGVQTDDFVKRRMLDALVDLFFGITTPVQAMMMLAGEAPPVPKVLIREVKEVLVKREKVLNLSDIKVLERVVDMYKKYEHGKLKDIKGEEIDKLREDMKVYNKKLKEVRKKLEKQIQQKAAKEVYGEVFKLLKTLLGNKSQEKLVKAFDKELIKQGKISPRFGKVLKELFTTKKKIQAGKLNAKEVENVQRDARELVDALVEYGQRAEIIEKEHTGMQISYDNRKAELVLFGKENFLVEGEDIKKITDKGLVKSKKEEFEKAIEENKGKLTTTIPGDVFETLKKELGEFEISM